MNDKSLHSKIDSEQSSVLSGDWYAIKTKDIETNLNNFVSKSTSHSKQWYGSACNLFSDLFDKN